MKTPKIPFKAMKKKVAPSKAPMLKKPPAGRTGQMMKQMTDSDSY